MAKSKKQFESAPELDEYVEPVELVNEIALIEADSNEFVSVTWVAGPLAGKTQTLRKTAAEIYKQKGLI